MELKTYREELRNYPGITRKNRIHHIIDFFPTISLPGKSGQIIAAWGEDCAVLDINQPKHLLFAADGIMKKLMDADPFWAGYCSVLVNIHDIVSMGGLPLAMVNILSISDDNRVEEVLQGINNAVLKFGVPIVGGHTHPDCEHNSISVAIIGTVDRDKAIYSHTAAPGEDIIVEVDLDGKAHDVFEYSWDTTRHKSKDAVWAQLNSMMEIAGKKLVTAGKDISNPGIIGTLGMLAEVSGVGAVIDLETIPQPDGLEQLRWLKMYQGMGFIVTAEPGKTDEVIDIFSKGGLTASKIGKIVDKQTITLRRNDGEIEVFDFSTDSITGIKPVNH
jgi:putative methanogenesis marker protein 2